VYAVKAPQSAGQSWAAAAPGDPTTGLTSLSAARWPWLRPGDDPLERGAHVRDVPVRSPQHRIASSPSSYCGSQDHLSASSASTGGVEHTAEGVYRPGRLRGGGKERNALLRGEIRRLPRASCSCIAVTEHSTSVTAASARPLPCLPKPLILGSARGPGCYRRSAASRPRKEVLRWHPFWSCVRVAWVPEGQRRHLHPNNREEMMLPQSNETLQVVAGIRLLAWSHLVRWDDGARQFYARSFDDFTAWWKHIEPTFGGLICWIQFAVGAEYLAKGVCLLCGQENGLIDDRGYPLTIGGLHMKIPRRKS
jgi:hypothetical protein